MGLEQDISSIGESLRTLAGCMSRLTRHVTEGPDSSSSAAPVTSVVSDPPPKKTRKKRVKKVDQVVASTADQTVSSEVDQVSEADALLHPNVGQTHSAPIEGTTVDDLLRQEPDQVPDTITIDQLSVALRTLATTHERQVVEKLFAKYNVTKLNQIPKSQYAPIMADVEAIQRG